VWKRINRYVSSITCYCQENITCVISGYPQKVMGCRTVVNPLLSAKVYRTVVNSKKKSKQGCQYWTYIKQGRKVAVCTGVYRIFTYILCGSALP